MRFVAGIVLAALSHAVQASSVERLDPALDALVAPDATVEVVHTGTAADSFEGPVWISKPAPGHLVFTDAPANSIYELRPDGSASAVVDRIYRGDLSKALHGGGTRLMLGANGATLDRQGRLVYTSYSAGEIVRVEADGTRTVLADRFENGRINAPNDVVVSANGSVYFTDSRASSAATQGPDCAQFWMSCGNPDGIPHKGVYFTRNGKVRLFSRDVDHPNGLAFSADGRYLYISNTILKNVLRFEVKADGSAGAESVLIDMSGVPGEGAPDGIKLDRQGNIWCTGPGGIWIISPTGKHLGTIRAAGRTNNFEFGGADGRMLYLVSADQVGRISLRVPGLRHFGAATPAAHKGNALVYAAVGPELRVYDLDTTEATLSLKSSAMLPAEIEAGVPDRMGHFVYIAWSDGTATSPGTRHGLTTFRIDPTTAELHPVGQPMPLPSRPIYASMDPAQRRVLIAYTSPSNVSVHPLAKDGAALEALSQPKAQLGIYGHQILVDKSSRMAILVARGNVPNASRAEDPGALNVFEYHEGILQPKGTIAPQGGYGFHPRNLAFHPTKPWVYVSLSQQNELGVYVRNRDGTLNTERLFEKSSLADPEHVQAGQLTGVMHVHPDGRAVYVANRATTAVQKDGKQVLAGGENSLGVFRIDPSSGEPTLIQNIDTRGIGPVEFAFDRTGCALVLANLSHLWVRDREALREVKPNLVLFRVQADGTLEHIRTYDIDAGDHGIFWMGLSPGP